MRAFNIGYRDAFKGMSKNNNYVRDSKSDEYEQGYSEGKKEKMKHSIKNRPQLFHNSISNHNKKRMTLIISGGSVQDVIRENIDCEIVIRDYDIDGIDAETNIHCRKDENGKCYQEIHLE